MAENKMTHKEMYALIANELAHIPEIVEFCESRVAQLEKPRKPRVNEEAMAFAEKVAEFIAGAGAPMANKELAEAMGVSSQKMAAALKRLEEAERIVRIKGEKKTDKDTFVLA